MLAQNVKPHTRHHVGQKVFVRVCDDDRPRRARVTALLGDGIRVHIAGEGKLLARAEFRRDNLRLVSEAGA